MGVIEYLQANAAFALLGAGLLGLVVGSFLNVVIYRLPLMMQRAFQAECAAALGSDAGFDESEPFNLAFPASRCPACGGAIAPWHNIPLAGYLWLKGRCADCAEPIPLRYPLVELTSGVLAVLTIMHFGATAAGLAALVLGWSLLAAAVIDLQHQLLPDAIVLPLLWLGLFVNLFHLFATPQAAIIGAMAGYLSLWTVYQGFKLLTGKEGMGYGDFKLLALLGAWMGWHDLPLIIILASGVGACTGIGLMASKRLQSGNPIPFGPFLAAAGWLALLWGPDLMQAYWRFAGLH